MYLLIVPCSPTDRLNLIETIQRNMGFDSRFGFMAFTKYNSELSGDELVDHLSIYFDEVEDWYDEVLSRGGISDERTTGRELVEAVIFAKENDFVDFEFDAILEDLYDISSKCKKAANQAKGFPYDQVPETFNRIDSFDPDSAVDQYSYEVKKEYDDGSFIELDYNSHDPSSPGQIKRDTSHARLTIKYENNEYSLWMRWKEGKEQYGIE